MTIVLGWLSGFVRWHGKACNLEPDHMTSRADHVLCDSGESLLDNPLPARAGLIQLHCLNARWIPDIDRDGSHVLGGEQQIKTNAAEVLQRGSEQAVRNDVYLASSPACCCLCCTAS